MWWMTESKACLLSMAVMISFSTLSVAEVHPWPARKPDCTAEEVRWDSKLSVICLAFEDLAFEDCRNAGQDGKRSDGDCIVCGPIVGLFTSGGHLHSGQRVQAWFHQTRESCFSWYKSTLGAFGNKWTVMCLLLRSSFSLATLPLRPDWWSTAEMVVLLEGSAIHILWGIVCRLMRIFLSFLE